MTTNRGNAVLVRSAIDLGHNLGLSVVAEGVEDPDTLDALRPCGADVVQGYSIARPMSEQMLVPWVKERDATPRRSKPPIPRAHATSKRAAVEAPTAI